MELGTTLEPYEQAALLDIVKAMRGSNVPVRRPSWNLPTFWSRSLTKTVAIPLDASSSWSTILEVTGLNAYTGVVTGYTATAFAPADIANVEFRIAQNGALVPSVSLASGVETNRESGAQFPTFPRSIYFLLQKPTDSLWIQARNNGTLQQMVLCGVFGWYFDNANQAEIGTLEGLTDA